MFQWKPAREGATLQRSRRGRHRPIRLLALGLGLLHCYGEPVKEPWSPPVGPATGRPPSDVRSACHERHPQGHAYFGDLHVHTGLSMDAWIFGTRTTPDDAYRFARGETIRIGPLDAEGRHTLPRRLARPLDFAAVTDHAEYLAEQRRCVLPSDVSESLRCRIFRGEAELPLPMGGLAQRMVGLSGLGRPSALCGDDGAICRDTLTSIWGEIQEAAERWYDRSPDCRFTTFVGFEWSFTPQRSKTHRNVIFRTASVPELPLSWIDTPSEAQLWQRLRELCVDAGTGCDAIAIPHNPNLSNGRSFAIPWRGEPPEEQRRLARLRAQMEPLVEMMQIKGESECRNGLWQVAGGPDELCDFEKRRGPEPVEDCEDGIGSGGQMGQGCLSRLGFVRYALIEGLREEARIGVNPYRFGLIGSTDGHQGTPGDVSETTTTAAGSVEGRPRPRPLRDNPGGLVGVWAEENSREALFDAMRRRETFATSGPRIRPRLFAGWDLPRNLCSRSDLVARATARGVPMGRPLAARPPRAGAPIFAATALRDAGTPGEPGGLLQRIQIVKGWVGEDGLFHQAIFDVAGSETGASVDPDSCEPRGSGSDALCGVWSDPAFDPGVAAVYYARVLENPSCRWSWRDCLAHPPGERPEHCADPATPRWIQERAWTSPIWYTPAATNDRAAAGGTPRGGVEIATRPHGPARAMMAP